MKNKQQKKEDLKALEAKLKRSTVTIFTTFAREGEKGLSVSQSQELKRALRQVNSEYLIAKKTLLEIALRDLKYDGIDIYDMPGSIGLVVGNENIYTIAKKMYEFAKKNQALQFFAGWLDGKLLTKDSLSEMALMPTREVLLSRLAGMMIYPLTALAMTLKQISEKNKHVS